MIPNGDYPSVMVAREAASFLEISRQAVYELWRRGRLKAAAERPLRFSKVDLAQYRAYKEGKKRESE